MSTRVVSTIILSAIFFTLAISDPVLIRQGTVANAPKPYAFGYEFGDGLGMSQHRQEVGDGSGAVKGSYGYVDPLGVYRRVDYFADANGYRAVVHSNEPGTVTHHSAHAAYLVEPPPLAARQQGVLLFKTDV